jgi:hypothetical protein
MRKEREEEEEVGDRQQAAPSLICCRLAAAGNENWVKYCMADVGTRPHPFPAQLP